MNKNLGVLAAAQQEGKTGQIVEGTPVFSTDAAIATIDPSTFTTGIDSSTATPTPNAKKGKSKKKT